MHLTLRRKFLVVLIGFDALLGVSSALTGINGIVGWIFLNAIVISPILYIRQVLKVRKQRYSRISNSHNQEYPPLVKTRQYGSTQITLKGEEVKSYGEKVIADYFFQNNINYEYETPVMEKRSPNKRRSKRNYVNARRISRPDFYLPDFDVYIEYWGLADAYNQTKRDEYTKSMNWKMDKYRENGIKFISIYKDNLDSLDSSFKSKLRDVTGINLNSNA
ncbi:MAG TPA: hypothetical protein VFA15_01270 [Nitrososphaera sp.]|nr:hypothetical protein [Nitrososphaera sp.]